MKYTMFLAVFACCALAACSESTEPDIPASTKPTPLVVQYPEWVSTYLSAMPVPADNPLTVEGVALGRKLFYETALSDDYTMSCASCHKQENAFSDPRAFSLGTNGAVGTRNAMAIINLAWSSNLFWDGRRSTLEGQAHDPVTNPIEMRNTWPVVVARLQNNAVYPPLFQKAFGTSTVDSVLVVKALAQFERTLVSFASRFDRYYFEGAASALSASERRGLDLFLGKADCNHCHTDVLMSDDALRNNGLDLVFADAGAGAVTGRAADNGKFKVPTLRNIAVTAPYMHDSRFTTLEQVVAHYEHGVQSASPNLDDNMENIKGGIALSAEERQDLLNFLYSLTDSTFLTNPAFARP